MLFLYLKLFFILFLFIFHILCYFNINYFPSIQVLSHYLALRFQEFQLPGTKMMQTMPVPLVVLQDFVLSLSYELFQDMFVIDMISHLKITFAMAKMTLTMKLIHLKRNH